ncbi:DUF2163 domain-containing protein [Pseudoduganella sp. UC29_106]|uniref:DUF2163 domain-containing protein n=1 Tax=Pseudoduganella sp. UC29_106 TaxID=3374553 RepID=UPI003757E7A7
MSSELKAHFAQPVTSICHLVKMTRRDGFILAVTPDYDQNITFDGTTYISAFGVIPTAAETSAALNVDTMEVTGALQAMGVNEADIAAGLWDLCEVHPLRVNYMDLSMGAEILNRYTFGEISLGRSSFTAEFRGITQKLQQTLADVVSPTCNANLFDARCGVLETEGVYKFSTQAITTATSQRQFTVSALTQDADFFTAGKVTFSSGANAGLSMEIKQHSAGGVIVLQEPMPYPVAEDDELTVWAGCRKRATEDCLGKFDNIIRFRGFNKIPGQDQMYKGV